VTTEPELVAAVAAIAAELASMPLNNANRDKRLALNARRETMEKALTRLRARAKIEAELASIKVKLDEAATPESDRKPLKRRQRELLTELEALQ
jgi:hypothetical protein